MGGFFNFNIEMKLVLLHKSIDRRAQGRGSSIEINRQVFVVVFSILTHSPQVPSSH